MELPEGQGLATGNLETAFASAVMMGTAHICMYLW